MYQIINRIGQGANGDVFLARKKQDNSTQVVKRLKIRDISQKQRQTIQTQLSLLKQFKHVNIVPFRDSYIDNQGNLNIVMAYCEGGDMHNLIQEANGKKFQQKKIIDWIIQLALSMFYLHQRRVLHRDIKTQNIFLTNGKLMLGDFGVSKVLDQAVDLAITNIGTPYYMSPQQYRHKPYSYKSDIWAFGCIIYEMCNHKHVFEALTLQALAVKVMKGIYSPVSQSYSQQLRGLVGQMLKQNPKDRPSIRQILTKPFLFGKVQTYMKKIYSQKQKYEPQMIKSLVDQANSLGFSLQQPKPKKQQKKQETPKIKKQLKASNSRQKLKQQSYKKYEKLNEDLKKQIQQRNRAQQQLKRIQKQKNQKKKSDKYSFQKPKPKKQQTSATQRSSKSKIKLEDISLSQAASQKYFKAGEQQKQDQSKNFKIVEQYDMDYEQYSDKQDNNKIYEEDQQQIEEQPKQIIKPKVIVPQKIPQKIKQAYIPNTQTPVKQQPKIQPKSQQKKQSKIQQKQQIQKPIKPTQDQLQKQVKQKTIIISSIRNQISKLDFIISSDSEDLQKQEKQVNPAFIRLTQKINDLKQKVISNLGRDGYASFLDFARNNIGKPQRNKVLQMVGQQNIGVWQIAENIIRLERVIVKIPK